MVPIIMAARRGRKRSAPRRRNCSPVGLDLLPATVFRTILRRPTPARGPGARVYWALQPEFWCRMRRLRAGRSGAAQVLKLLRIASSGCNFPSFSQPTIFEWPRRYLRPNRVDEGAKCEARPGGRRVRKPWHPYTRALLSSIPPEAIFCNSKRQSCSNGNTGALTPSVAGNRRLP